MTADGRIDMIDIMGIIGGGALDLTPPKSCGRIVTGFNGIILGLETKSEGLAARTVYDIKSHNGTLILEKMGKSHIDFNTSNQDIPTILLTQQQKLILTDVELNRLEVEEEIELNGFLTTRDKYLILSDKEKPNSTKAMEKLKVLSIMYPRSKFPDKWV